MVNWVLGQIQISHRTMGIWRMMIIERDTQLIPWRIRVNIKEKYGQRT